MLIQLINEEAIGARSRIILAAALSGAANAAILAIVNTAAQNATHPSAVLFFMMIAAVIIYTICLRICIGTLSGLLESALCKIRIRMASKIRKAELLGLEQVGTSEIYERLTHQTGVVSNAAWPLALGLQSSVMLLCSILYLTMTSPEALLLTVAVYGTGAVYYYFRSIQAQKLLQKTAITRMRLLDILNDLLLGFKENRFNSYRSDAVHADFSQVADTLRQRTVETNILNQSNYVFAHVNQFALLAAVVFILPQFSHIAGSSIPKIVSALIFMFSPIGTVLFAFPEYDKANLATQNIRQLEDRLTGATEEQSDETSELGPFKELRMENVEFRRTDAQGQLIFGIGPLNLTIKAGEIVFFVGGNGSGKTTTMRTLTGLYPPSAGALLINGIRLGPHNIQSYREMIAAIFTDFHLFKTLYGFEDEVSVVEVQKLLQQMEIANKTKLVDGMWTSVEMSTGQRKRLAMVISLLEDRPIYIFDEWAADQDPEFRHYFYEVLLQDLKKRGKTVIAISHDDRFFHCADQVITLEYGKVRSSVRPRDNPGPQPTMIG